MNMAVIDQNWESLDSKKSARLLTSNRMAEKCSSPRKRAKGWARRNKERQNGILS